MKVSYKGIKNDLPVKLQEKLDVRFSKLSKLVDGRGEKTAHVVVTSERHLHKAEITLHFHDHQLVGLGSDADLFNALSGALDKIEKQAAKQGSKWREKTRRSEPMKAAATKTAPDDTPAPVAGPRVFRPNHHERRKPITLDEALLLMDKDRDYVAYRDAEKECVAVLVRRRDGNFDLIEA